MEGHEQLAKMTRVRAPEGFERTVLARLPDARRERIRARRAVYRYAFAGSAALVLVGFLVFGPSAPTREPDAALTLAEREALTATPDPGLGRPVSARRSGFVPVYETMDYSSEFRAVQAQPRTVYILEQVSESASSEIVY